MGKYLGIFGNATCLSWIERNLPWLMFDGKDGRGGTIFVGHSIEWATASKNLGFLRDLGLSASCGFVECNYGPCYFILGPEEMWPRIGESADAEVLAFYQSLYSEDPVLDADFIDDFYRGIGQSGNCLLYTSDAADD